MEHFDKKPICSAEKITPPRLLAALLRLETAQTPDDVWALMVRVAEGFGLGIVDYIFDTDLENPDHAPLSRTTFSAEWEERLETNSSFRQAGRFEKYSGRYLTPTLTGLSYLGDMGELSPSERRHIIMADEMGLKCGLVIPLRFGEPRQAAQIIFGGAVHRERFDALMAQHCAMLIAFAQAAHMRFTELYKTNTLNQIQLTPKQIELVHLVGQGLMDKQIAHQLGISFSAVRQRLAMVQSKTGTQNRADLAALAARVGLIPDPLIRVHRDVIAPRNNDADEQPLT